MTVASPNTADGQTKDVVLNRDLNGLWDRSEIVSLVTLCYCDIL